MQTRSKIGKMAGNEVILKKLESIQTEITTMKASIGTLHTQFTQIHEELTIIKDLKQSIEHTEEDVREVQNNVSLLQDTIQMQAARIKEQDEKIESNRHENMLLKERQLAQDTYSRRENLKFEGIPEESNEKNDQTITRIRNLFRAEFGIEEASDMKFQRCHRMGYKLDRSKPRDVIVRFVLYPDREKVWKSRSKLKNTEIIMKEDFPEEIEFRRSKLYQIHKNARAQHYKTKMVADKLIINGTKYTISSLDKLPSKLHPKAYAERHTDDSVLFYGSHSVFSNFYSVEFTVDGQIYNSTEQYYQMRRAELSGDKGIFTKIKQSLDPKEQYYFGKKLSLDDQIWNNNIAVQVMEKATREKFRQNTSLKQQLINTGEKSIIQCNPHDLFWANGLKMTDQKAEDCTKWKGQNNLGKVLCNIRDSFK